MNHSAFQGEISSERAPETSERSARGPRPIRRLGSAVTHDNIRSRLVRSGFDGRDSDLCLSTMRVFMRSSFCSSARETEANPVLRVHKLPRRRNRSNDGTLAITVNSRCADPISLRHLRSREERSIPHQNRRIEPSPWHHHSTPRRA